MDAAIEKLIATAIEARKNAYAKFSNYNVGAAVLTASGDIYSGANVENSSYGATICAERVAAASAVADGHRELSAVAIVTDEGAAPCGMCRQFLCEFASAKMRVLLISADQDDAVEELSLADLLPRSFKFG